MQKTLEEQAIKAALAGDWHTATNLNRQILSGNPNHIPSLNRLAKALAQLGDTEAAIATYQQVLSLDHYNTIAHKQCAMLSKGPCIAQERVNITMTNFVEEPGKTKTHSLVRLGDSKLLSTLQSGQSVVLVPKNHWIVVTTESGSHIGCLAENISFTLKQKINDGVKFDAAIRMANSKQVSVFIREL